MAKRAFRIPEVLTPDKQRALLGQPNRRYPTGERIHLPRCLRKWYSLIIQELEVIAMKRTNLGTKWYRPGKITSLSVALSVLTMVIVVCVTSVAVPTSWFRITETDALGAPPTDNPTQLFVFGNDLYAYNDYGLYHRMQETPCVKWEKLSSPVVSPGNWSFTALGSVLYASSASNQLYMIGLHQAVTPANWQAITSSGTPGGADPRPRILFGGYIYGVHYPSEADTFEIWRSADHGKTTMAWTKVVPAGFEDPQNRTLGFLVAFNNKLIAVTDQTRTGVFGDSSGFQQGIETWESPTGNSGSWEQVNVDGFGTQLTKIGTGKSFRTNQDVGSAAVYQGHLYVGTKSHYGAEVWRYDGSGKAGWANVTPVWAGVFFPGSYPGRNEAMAVYGDELYLGEGFPTGNLAKYNGSTWSIVESGSNPFHADNGGIGSLAVLGGKLYAATLHAFNNATAQGDQVWGYPYNTQPEFCITPGLPDLITPGLPDLLYDPPLIRYLIPDLLIEIFPILKYKGSDPIDRVYLIAIYLDRELVYLEEGPFLGPDETAELFYSFDVSPGEHTLILQLDPENAIEEIDEENNVTTITFSVPEGEREEPRERGLELRVEAVPICRSSRETHELHIAWFAGGEPFEGAGLAIVYPDGRTDAIELWAPEGELPLVVGQSEGGLVTVTLRVETPQGVANTTTSVYLPPC